MATNKKAVSATEQTPEQVAQAMASAQATKERNAAYAVLLDYVTKTANAPEAVIAACKVIRPSYFGIAGATTGDGLTPAYRKLLQLTNNAPKVGDTFTLMQLFTAYRFGQTEAKNWCNELTKLPVEGQPLVWVKRNITEQTYTIVGIGDAVPDDWTGYMPKHLNNGKAVQASKQ